MWWLVGCGGPSIEVGTVDLGDGLTAHELRLDNGLRAFVVPDPRPDPAPVATVQVWLDAGGADDPPGKAGLAHLFEHLVFGPTDAWGDGDWDRTLQEAGAIGVNAWTWPDETAFVERVPAAEVDGVLRREAVRLRRLRLDDAALTRERAVVLAERGQRIESDPSAVLREKLLAKAFPGDPYGRPTAGVASDLGTVTTADLRSFYDAAYAPDRTTILVVGDVRPEAVAATLQEAFGAMSRVGSRSSAAPAVPSPGTVSATLDADEDRVALGFPAPARGDPDRGAAEVVDAMLSAGQSAALRRGLEATGLASQVGTTLPMQVRGGLWTVEAIGRRGVAADALADGTRTVLASLSFDARTVGRARRQALASRRAGLEDGAGFTAFLGQFAVGGGDVRRGRALLAAIAATTPDDARRVAARWLDPARSVTALGAGSRRRPEDWARSPDAVRGALAAPGDDPAPPRPIMTFDPPLSDGHVHVVPDPSQPLLDLVIGWPTGSAADPPGRSGATNLAVRGMLRGACPPSGCLDRSAFEQAIEDLGASVEVDVGTDTTIVHARVLAEAWPAFFPLLRAAILSPADDPEEIGALRQQMANRMLARLEDPAALASRAFLQEYWGPSDPWGTSPIGAPRDLAAITAEDLRASRSRLGRDVQIGLAGAVPSGATADLQAFVQALPEATAARPPAAAVPGPSRVVLVDRPGPEAAIVVGGGGPGRSAYTASSWLGLQAFGGGAYTSALMERLREKQGLTYHVAASVQLPPDGRGTLAVTTLVPVDRAAETIRAILDLEGEIRAGGLDPAGLARVRRWAAAGAPFLTETALKRSNLAVTTALLGRSEPALRAAAAGVSDADATRALAPHLDPSVIVVVGPKESLEEALAAFGPVRVRRYDGVW